ncbi:MAG: phage head-tail connector protein [Parasphingorhabdus sp.]|uniref:head-tail connector protein n=1 Tax=Parasphingorhabdus sp. TaxID=2709688 RepID=UPI0032971331
MITHLLVTALLSSGGTPTPTPTPTPSDPYAAFLGMAKEQLRIGASNEQDVLLTGYIGAAVKYIERETNQVLLNRSLKITKDCWPENGVLTLRKRPVVSVDTVHYYASDGTRTLLGSTEYQVSIGEFQTRIVPSPEKTWPELQSRRLDAIEIDATFGYGAAIADLPEDLRHVILLLVAHWDDNRGAVAVGTISKELELSVDALLEHFLIPSVG